MNKKELVKKIAEAKVRVKNDYTKYEKTYPLVDMFSKYGFDYTLSPFGDQVMWEVTNMLRSMLPEGYEPSTTSSSNQDYVSGIYIGDVDVRIDDVDDLVNLPIGVLEVLAKMDGVEVVV
jgi:hypothetical protein